MLFVLLIPFRGLHLQKTVDRLRLHPGGFRKPFRRAAGGRCQQDPCAGFPERGNNTKGRRCLSGSRASGEDQDLALHRRQDRLHLDLVVLNACPAADPFRQPCGIHPDPFHIGEDRLQALCRAGFRKIKRREIDRFLRDSIRRRVLSNVRRRVLRKRDRFNNDILRVDHFVQRHGEHTLVHGKELRACL